MSRIKQFDRDDIDSSLVLTNVGLFIDKARLMQNCHFVIGWDTFIRILNPKYYDNSQKQLIAVLDMFNNYGTKFVVAGRLVDGKWHTPANDWNLVPNGYSNLFLMLTDDEFRVDLSSSEIR